MAFLAIDDEGQFDGDFLHDCDSSALSELFNN